MSGWEVVNRKKGRNEPTKTSNKQQKKKVESMPKLEEIAPIQESQTMFEAFIEKERKKNQLQNDHKMNGAANKMKNKENNLQQQHKKKHPDKKKNQPKVVPLDESIKSLNGEEMKNRFAAGEARFPETPMFWLKDLASFLNLNLDVELTDPIFSTKSTDYPTSSLSSEITELLHTVFKKCPTNVLESFFEFCLISMVYESLKGLNTMGYRICLQCLAQDKPSIVLGTISKAIDLRNAHQNRQNICLSILWALGQAGFKNLEVGMRVWIDVMFPIIGSKGYSKYVVEYLEMLLNRHKSKKISKTIIAVKDLFPILDFVHTPVILPGNLQKQLVLLYPMLKALSYGPDPSNILRSYFPSYLRRLEPGCSPSLRNEVLSSLVECLAIDKLSFSVWRQFYTKHFVQSSILITHLHEEWDRLPSTFPRKLLLETLNAFQVTNEELKGHGKGTQGIETCTSACKALICKMNAQRFSWFKLLLSLVVLISAILAYDVQQHGSFKSSKTGELMKQAGVLAVSEQAWGKITVYSGKAAKWLEVNVPVFSTWVCQTFGPYLEIFWEKLFSLSVYLWDSTLFIRTWVNTNVPPFLEKVSKPVPAYLQSFSMMLEGILVNIITLVLRVIKVAEHYASGLTAWLYKNVFTGSLSPENLQKYAGDAVEVFQQYTTTTYNWITKSIASVYHGR